MPIVLADMFGPKNLSNSFGIALFFTAFGCLFGPPIISKSTGDIYKATHFLGLCRSKRKGQKQSRGGQWRHLQVANSGRRTDCNLFRNHNDSFVLYENETLVGKQKQISIKNHSQ